MPFIKGWLSRNKDETEAMLGRTTLYFPIFEHHLKAYGLPDELKALPIVESNLRPYAESVAGAGGLWQFTAPTAKKYGLLINSSKDERRDANKSSEAAARHLARLFKGFGNWELALLAYNCGEGRLKRAIEAAGGSRKISVLMGFLPKETCDYLPRFLAARYLIRYHSEHGLTPVFPASDWAVTRPMLVFSSLSFKEIAASCGVEIQTLKLLNPGYYHSWVSADERGSLLVLPARAAARFAAHPSSKAPLVKPSGNFSSVKWVVQSGDTAEKLARLSGCRVTQIQAWNGLPSSALFLGQELILWFPSPVVAGNRA